MAMHKRIPRFAAALIVSLSVIGGAVTAQESASGNDANGETKIIIPIGVRPDAEPFSHTARTSAAETVMPGYGGYSVEVCRHVLKEMQKIPEFGHYDFRAREVSADSRFDELAAGEVFMLCGPDSMTEELLDTYRASHPVFLSGMTFGYLNPESELFPRGPHCDHVIGVVRATTADKDGLVDIAGRDILMRFDSALDQELGLQGSRVQQTRKSLLELTVNVRDLAVLRRDYLKYVEKFNGHGSNWKKIKEKEKLTTEINEIDELLRVSDLNNIDQELKALEGNGRVGIIRDRMEDRHKQINIEYAQQITTPECPNGFTSMPVKKYENHTKGMQAFCEGEVLYYLSDYDILRSKLKEFGGCDVELNRFTRTREVYGFFFSKDRQFKLSDSVFLSTEDVTNFYVTFNNELFKALQGAYSPVEAIFHDVFGIGEMSDELATFFDNQKITSIGDNASR